MGEVKKWSIRSIGFRKPMLMARLTTLPHLSLSLRNPLIFHRNQSLPLRKEEIGRKRNRWSATTMMRMKQTVY
jgi:hypothetical protein